MRLRRFMRCDRGLRKSIRVAFSDGYSGAAAMTGWDMGIRTAKPKHWTRPDRGLPRFDNLPDCRRWHKLSATLIGGPRPFFWLGAQIAARSWPNSHVITINL